MATVVIASKSWRVRRRIGQKNAVGWTIRVLFSKFQKIVCAEFVQRFYNLSVHSIIQYVKIVAKSLSSLNKQRKAYIE